MKRVLVMLMVVGLVAAAQAAVIDSFVNLDFDSGAVTPPSAFKGFDAPDATEIVGWSNYPAGPLVDSGVEGPTAWWAPYDTNAAFMKNGDAAYNMSSYTIQAGDVFTIGFVAKAWTAGWAGSDPGEWTATLFYDDPANVVGSFVQSNLTGDWTAYSDAAGIAATGASVGGTLGILMQSSGNRFACIDEITVAVVPEPATMLLLGLGAVAMLKKRK